MTCLSRPLHHFVVPLPRYAGEYPEASRPAPTWILPRSRGRGTAEGGGGGGISLTKTFCIGACAP